MRQFKLFGVMVACGLMLFAGTSLATAGFITTDGNFNNQANGVAIVSPGNNPSAGATGSAASQSPFTNVFASNGMGAYAPAGASYFVQEFAAVSTGMLYLNVDFQRVDNNVGHYGFTVGGPGYGAARAVQVAIDNAGLYADSAAGLGDLVMPLETGVWYNLQIALDLNQHSYSGTVTREVTLAQTAISSRATWYSGAVDRLYEDPANNFGNDPDGEANMRPARVDNFVLSTTPFASPLPEPGTLTLLGIGILGLLAYALRKRK